MTIRFLSITSVLALSLTSLSCGNGKTSTENSSSHDFMANGTVKISEETGDCALWIMSTKTSSVAGYYPINLDDQFKVNDLKIAFNFNDSRAPLPDGCHNLKAIVISEVKILK